jgi:hypothetical protein
MNKKIIKTDGNVEIHILSDGTAKQYDDYANSFKKRVVKPSWAPANRTIFMQDIRKGIPFCKSKYGVSEAKLKKYVKEALPHINLDKIKMEG